MKGINKEDIKLAKEVQYWAGRLIGHEQAYDISEEIVNTIKSVEAKFNHVDLADVIHWVAIEDGMPESGECVMIFSKNGGVAEGAYMSAKGHFEQWRWNAVQKDVTHWKPLCEPPCL